MKELDVVKLKNGLEATILEAFGGSKEFLVEIADDSGKTLDLPIVGLEEIEQVIQES